MPWMIAAATLGSAAIGAMSSGGGGGQTQSMPSNQNTQTIGGLVPNSAAMPLYGYAAGNANAMMQTSRPYFPGQTYVSPSALTQMGVDYGAQAQQGYQNAYNAYNQAGSMGGMASDAYMKSMGQYDDVMKQLKGFASRGGSGGNYSSSGGGGGSFGFVTAGDMSKDPNVARMMDANEQRARQQLMEEWLPGINQGANTVNAMGSSRQGIAQAQGIERTAQQVTNANAGAMMDAWGKQLQSNTGIQQSNIGAAASRYATDAQRASARDQLALQAIMNQATVAGLAPQAAMGAMGAYGACGDYYSQAGAAGTTGANNLIGYGQTVEGYQQAALQDQMNRFNYPYDQAQQNQQNVYGAMQALAPIGRQYSGQGQSGVQTSNNPNYMSPYQGAISGATLGLGAYNQYQQAQNRNQQSIGYSGAGNQPYTYQSGNPF